MRSNELILTAPVRTEMYVVRHAEVHNPKDIVYGRLPRFGLSAKGRRQAELAGGFLGARDVSTVYTSPMLRARQSALIATRAAGLPKPKTLGRLIEVRTSYQGQPNSILKPGFSFYHPRAAEDDETMEAVCERMLTVLRMLARRHAGERVAFVSHADPIAILRLGLERRPLTTEALHSTVYPARSSITLVQAWPDRDPWLAYYDVVGEGAT